MSRLFTLTDQGIGAMQAPRFPGGSRNIVISEESYERLRLVLQMLGRSLTFDDAIAWLLDNNSLIRTSPEGGV